MTFSPLSRTLPSTITLTTTLSDANENPDLVRKHLIEDSNILIDWFKFNRMQANPEKCQAIAIGQRSAKELDGFTLNNVNISCENEVKLLGVTIDFKLNFNSHISNICKKASKQLNCLKRIGKYLTRLGKLTVYHSFILSNFNYCPLTWHFCSETNTNKVERIQERALRFIYDDHSSSYEDLLSKSNLPSLKLRRIRFIALETFKILHRESLSFLHDLVSYKNNSYNFRYRNTAEVPRTRTTRYGLQSFSYRAAIIWNSLPNEARDISNFNQFKHFINLWDGPDCKCNDCKGQIT